MSETFVDENLNLDEINPETDEESSSEETEAATVTVEELVLDLVVELQEPISPYKLHSVVNAAFEAFGSARTVRPQMMYNYAQNGLIVKGQKGRKSFTRDEVAAFVTKFVTKHLSA